MDDVSVDPRFIQLVRKLVPDAHLLRAWPLMGGISAQVTALEIRLPDDTLKKWVIRQQGDYGYRVDPGGIAKEAHAMVCLKDAGVAVPGLIYQDDTRTLLDFPFLIMEYIDGEAQFAPPDLPRYLEQFTQQLVRIHIVDASLPALQPLPNLHDAYTLKVQNQPATLDDTLQEGRIRQALAAFWPFSRMNAVNLLHGDYWPGNVLWRDEMLAAVIDFEDVALGDPLADLSNSRIEVLWAFGTEAMRDFTRLYQALRPELDYANLAQWDLFAALRPAGQISEWAWNADDERHMREVHAWFVADIFERLGQ
ncbi:phosphotransferase [Phototrophicus methaneseepsis]|uniref:Phosphotransferase n=1 Tax=Phototrophicus methaneseepsis TaxID=2710758 RepID=A0A7S8E7V4_9CHLR|nr:phosphotransferase [Phototrophicus methaneseepsis]QPC81981.1 phosphotransferase [Phototrophicus methaneseepsis]